MHDNIYGFSVYIPLGVFFFEKDIPSPLQTRPTSADRCEKKKDVSNIVFHVSTLMNMKIFKIFYNSSIIHLCVSKN